MKFNTRTDDARLVSGEAAQRLALPAGGWDELTPVCRNQLQAVKTLENAQSPTSRVHALLGALNYLLNVTQANNLRYSWV
jgi:hypothetical protein